jgi:glycosyltransferase involved in cell wall biosynthesis
MTGTDLSDTANVLIISQDIVGPYMAGSGIRYWEFARQLGREFQVTLAAPNPVPQSAEGFGVLGYEETNPRVLQDAAEHARVVIAGGYLLRAFPFLLTLDRPLVIDAYIPYPLEVLELNSGHSLVDQITGHADALLTLNLQFMCGDLFLCASDKQRDLWLGLLLAQGRINPLTYHRDRTLRGLLDVVPFGLPEQPPRLEKPVLRGIHPAVGPAERVILWGGGIWQWLDPLTLVRAMANIKEQRSDVRVFFPGTRHPNVDAVPDMEMRRATLQLSDELGMTDRQVIFGDWVPYHDRQNYLLEADLGASLHFETVEARFSFRTRLLDYIWAGLPMITTRGDTLSDVVEQHGLGRAVDPENVEDVTAVILELLDVPNLKELYQPRFQGVAAELTWRRVMEPLFHFCREPRRAVDRCMTDRRIYTAWIEGLQRASRKSQEAHLSLMQEHIRDLSHHVESLNHQVEFLQRLVESYRTSYPVKVYRALKRRMGRAE